MGLSAFAIFLSFTTQSFLGSGVGGVALVLLLRLASSLGLAGPLNPYFLTNQFDAWLNLTRDPIEWGSIVRSAYAVFAVATCVVNDHTLAVDKSRSGGCPPTG